ncbi:hypothetical protein [Nocardia africana]
MAYIYVLESCAETEDHSSIDGTFSTPAAAMKFAQGLAGKPLDWGPDEGDDPKHRVAHLVREGTYFNGRTYRTVDAYYITRFPLDPEN